MSICRCCFYVFDKSFCNTILILVWLFFWFLGSRFGLHVWGLRCCTHKRLASTTFSTLLHWFQELFVFFCRKLNHTVSNFSNSSEKHSLLPLFASCNLERDSEFSTLNTTLCNHTPQNSFSPAVPPGLLSLSSRTSAPLNPHQVSLPAAPTQFNRPCVHLTPQVPRCANSRPPFFDIHVFTVVPADFFLNPKLYQLINHFYTTVPVAFFNHVMLIVPVGNACTKHPFTHNLASISILRKFILRHLSAPISGPLHKILDLKSQHPWLFSQPTPKTKPPLHPGIFSAAYKILILLPLTKSKDNPLSLKTASAFRMYHHHPKRGGNDCMLP
ncbi:hypothetical protein VP01_3028g1 [Puccinia sorghi]|uniref:Uncharacterized protein n=1 Tax=Puccinia sorghi TaxID=27349 RepID=A0A0L6V027_9BASI|nr:hypothetical protein VP01_3028g1 [Puccinia sorghi]